jgi:hypothetical protein
VKKRLATILVALLAMFGIAATAVPANASPPSPVANGFKFWSPSICVDGSGINGTYYRVADLAQQWNLKTSTIALNYEDDCAAAGYPPSRRMVVGTYNNPADTNCTLKTNTQSTFYNGFYRWTNGPGIYINVANPYCVGSQTRRDHMVSGSIGYLLGLGWLQSDNYNSRVMNGTEWSRENVGTPDVYSGAMLTDIYNGVYCDSGTAC